MIVSESGRETEVRKQIQARNLNQDKMKAKKKTV